MLGNLEKVIFILLILATAAAFLYPMAKRYRIVRSGRPDERFRDLWRRFWSALTKVLFQRCTLKNERFFTGLMHVLIFYGALTFDTMTISHTLEGFFNGFYLFGDTSLGLFFSFLVDAAAFMVMAGILFLAFRRFVLKPKAYATTPGDSAVIYLLITVATATYLYFEGFAIAHHPDTARWAFLGKDIAESIRNSGLSDMAIAAHFRISWWAHIIAVYGFIAYVPHSKYLHMFAGPFNVFFRRDAPSGELSALNLEESETFGIEKLTDFTWKDNLDAFSCMECGRCQDVCPAFATDKPLSPKMILVNQEKALLKKGKQIIAGDRENLDDLVPGTFSEGEIWTCTTCGACMHVCPVEIEHIPKLIGLRQSRVLMHSQFPAELNTFFRNMETNSNPWGIGFSKRADWSVGHEVPLINERPDAEYLFWVGCMGAFDDEGQKISRALVTLLNRAGVKFAILGTEEKCCGDSARRLGNEYLFQTLAQENLELWKKHQVRKIITICPHGYNTFKHEYPRLLDLIPALSAKDKEHLKAIEVFSHIEIIQHLLQAGKLSLSPQASPDFTYHDPCYLGRHNRMTKEPRTLLDAALEGRLLELGNHGEHSFCCGAGGGLMWTEESLGSRINHRRVDEILHPKVGLAATSCPFCLTMLRDGLKDKQQEGIPVKDISQIILDALVGPESQK